MDKPVLHYYKKNVPYLVALRYYIGDSKGKVLNNDDPYIVIEDEDLRDFTRANRDAISQQIIVLTTEPDIEEVKSSQVMTDEKATDVVKNVFALKKALASLDSEPMIVKLLDKAKELDRPKKTIALIEARLGEISGPSLADMRGVYTDAPEINLNADRGRIY